MPNVILATASYDRTIKFWEAPSGNCVRTLQFQDSHVNCMAISPHKSTLVAAGYHHIRMFDLQSGTPCWSVEAHQQNITSVGFQKDGKWIYSGSEDNWIKIWDVRTQSVKRKYDCKAPVNAVALHCNQGEIISGDSNGLICLWDLKLDACLQYMAPKVDVSIRSITINAGGDLACVANNQGDVFCIEIGESLGGMNMERSFSGSVISPSAAATASAIGGGGGLGLTTPSGSSSSCLPQNASNTDSGMADRLRLVHTFPAHNRYILKCLFSPNQKLLATTSADWTIKLWNTSKAVNFRHSFDTISDYGGGVGPGGGITPAQPTPWTLWKVLHGHNRWVWDCAFSADSAYLVSASSDHTAKLWDVNKGISLVNYTSHLKPVICIVLDDASPTPSSASAASASPSSSSGDRDRDRGLRGDPSGGMK